MNNNQIKRYCLALDLIDDPALIAQYEYWHQAENGWPEVKASIQSSGVLQMEIYRTGNRLFMIIEASNDFDFNRKAQEDANNAIVQQWENMMSKFQKPLSWAGNGEKWVLMNKIFQLQSPDF
ncbi:L-rhamnose mutarotase [Mucilaginibacter terrae]|uniref:L-rhamnose mutarotase n=1 Tax=Mucilaginibacter terrae TaxID=1955052 RepID=A0ABU3GN10_9SPHI|nr:L-rhamnose mutarotase [Mucilaginibacter terrae]MDT3401164.1 L-rhamnose mutarotase [Mucilaginibacter terrae]